MRQPSIDRVPNLLRSAAIEIARRLQQAGHRAWIVGGALRDLALEREPGDVDMACAATPEEIEALFERTTAVGRAFGTVIVHCGLVDVELTTFRSEEGYSDARRPDVVRYGVTVEEDASRRDFTCNALYLDPLDDSFRDPTTGMADLELGVLRCVGDARQRFREDGLRLIRLARFSAGLGLEPAPGTVEAARAEADALRGVSSERALAELIRIFEAPRSGRAIAFLEDCGLVSRLMPDLKAGGAFEHASGSDVPWEILYGELPSPPGATLGLAALLDPTPDSAQPEVAVARLDQALEMAQELRASRKLRGELAAVLRTRQSIDALILARSPQSEQTIDRAGVLLTMRAPCWSSALALARAWAVARGADAAPFETLATERAQLGDEDLSPELLITSKDLHELGCPPGPRWGRLLALAERQQLNGELTSKARALEWLQGELGSSDSGGGE